jgi:hypothetical protein
MKTCPVCNLDFEDEFVFCHEDGTRLEFNVTLKAEPLIHKEIPTTPNILFCPVCQREYPLTFSTCPVDGLRLTREKLVAVKKETPAPDTQPLAAAIAEDDEPEVIEQVVEQVAETSDDDEPTLGELVIEDPAIEPSVEDAPSVGGGPRGKGFWASLGERLDNLDPVRPLRAAAALLSEFLRRFKPKESPSSEEAREPNLRFAARATIVGLLLFGLISAYVAYDYLNRRPKPSPQAAEVEYVENRTDFIPTPQSARDYVDVAVSQPEAEIPVDQGEGARERNVIVVPSRGKAEEMRQLLSYGRKQHQEPARNKAAAPPAVAGPIRSQSTEGRIAARLVQVRSNKSRPGMRYDLTFVLSEEAGRTVRWQKMLISTTSARGKSSTQTIPFHHRHGAQGSLRFTVSVQMQGRSASDFKGRVVCTTIGSDDSGRQMRASFGANVAP